MSTLAELRSERDGYWSQSRINTFLLCSLKYAFQYIHKLRPEHTSAALPFGSAVHRTLEMMHLLKRDCELPADSETRELFDQIWTRELAETPDICFKDGQEAESCRAQGMDLVSVFRANMPGDERVLLVSKAYAMPLAAHDGRILEQPLIGEIDLLVEDADGRKRIIDWKTAARKWSAGQADTALQPTAMLYLWHQNYGEMLDFEYRIATKTKTPGYQAALTSRTPDDFDRMVEIIRMVERAITAEAFMPNDGCFACGDCQFAGACKRWVQDKARLISLAA